MTNPKDTIKLDVPLFIRLLEYAREDAKSDMDLHELTDNIIEMSSEGRVLSMDDYEFVLPTNEEEELREFFRKKECKMKELIRMNQLAGNYRRPS
jgi:hypothetical protein